MSQLLDIYAGLTGTILPTVATSAPTGWLLCDGSAVSRTTYANLYTLVGTTFGAGDGSTTFNVPDLRGRTVIGVGTGAGLTARTRGQTGGAEVHQLGVTEIPAHGHDIYAGTDNTSGNSVAAANAGARGFAGSNSVSGLTTITNFPGSGQQAVRNAGGNGSHNNMQPFMALSYIIRS